MTTFAGWQLTVQWGTAGGTLYNLDGIQRITYDEVTGVEPKEECGSRYPKYLVEGIYGLTGTIERYFTGSPAWSTYFVPGNEAQTPVDIKIWPNGITGGYNIMLRGCKMGKASYSHRPGSNLMLESWDFVGTGSAVVSNT